MLMPAYLLKPELLSSPWGYGMEDVAHLPSVCGIHLYIWSLGQVWISFGLEPLIV